MPPVPDPNRHLSILIAESPLPFFPCGKFPSIPRSAAKVREDIKQGNADKSSDGRQQHQESAHFCLELDHDRSDNRECREKQRCPPEADHFRRARHRFIHRTEEKGKKRRANPKIPPNKPRTNSVVRFTSTPPFFLPFGGRTCSLPKNHFTLTVSSTFLVFMKSSARPFPRNSV